VDIEPWINIAMVLNYQRWTPPCGCSFEQEVNSETGEIKLLFGHTICGGHEDIAKTTLLTNSSKTLQSDETKREQIINKKLKAWEDNKIKNLDDFENHEHIKRIKNKLKVEMKNVNPSPETLFLQRHYQEERDKVVSSVDKFTESKHIEMLIGLECPYSLDSQDVYNTIVKEQQEEAKKVNPNG
jgi:hypothetical protein